MSKVSENYAKACEDWEILNPRVMLGRVLVWNSFVIYCDGITSDLTNSLFILKLAFLSEVARFVRLCMYMAGLFLFFSGYYWLKYE